MATRHDTESWTTASVSAGGTLTENRSIGRNWLDITKIKVVPSVEGVTSKLQLFGKDTHLAADLMYSSGNFAGTLYDPEELDGTTSTERNRGEPIPYDDLDLSGELHTKITNNDSQAKTYTITIDYEPVLKVLTNTATWDPASINDGDTASTTVTVTGATLLNSTCTASFSSITAADWFLSAYVTAADTVTVTLLNETGGAVDLGSGTLRVHVFQEA